MDRFWLLTWTTHGTWLIGDPRGFVGNTADPTGKGVRHNAPGTPYARDLPRLRDYMAARAGEPVFLAPAHAGPLIEQFRETAGYRGWDLLAAAVMRNHVHVLVGVPGDPEPDALLRDFKSYASRRLNRAGLRVPDETWWTQGGSKRKRASRRSVRAAVRYVRRQPRPLPVWSVDDARVEAAVVRLPETLPCDLQQRAYARRSP